MYTQDDLYTGMRFKGTRDIDKETYTITLLDPIGELDAEIVNEKGHTQRCNRINVVCWINSDSYQVIAPLITVDRDYLFP